VTSRRSGNRNHSSTSSDGHFLRGGPPTGSRTRRSFLFLALAAGVVITVFSLIGENGLPTYLQLHNERSELKDDVEALRGREAELTAEMEALENDPEALERLAREKYRMRLPGEEVIEVVGEDLLENGDNAGETGENR